MTFDLDDIRVRAIEPLYTPQQIKEGLPVSPEIASTVSISRKCIREISPQGLASIIRTQGHSITHLVLRGGRNGPNCDPATMLEALQKMDKMGLNPKLLVDCSHGNSNKQALAQMQVWDAILEFHQSTEPRVFGAMVESFLETGRQDLRPDGSFLPGLSITDSCLGWAETKQLILKSADKLRESF